MKPFDPLAPGGKWEGDSSGTSAELEGPTAACQVGQYGQLGLGGDQEGVLLVVNVCPQFAITVGRGQPLPSFHLPIIPFDICGWSLIFDRSSDQSAMASLSCSPAPGTPLPN